MDEYLFIAMAKLKADRLKLEAAAREARTAGETAAATSTSTAQSASVPARSAPNAAVRLPWFARGALWREQS